MCYGRYLIEKGARLEAVNNDGELAFDLADGSDMENLLSDTMETQGATDYNTQRLSTNCGSYCAVKVKVEVKNTFL